MANIQQVSFDAPLDLEAERRKIDRSRKMAEMLQQQAMQPGQQGQMVSGHYVAPSPLSALAKVLQGYAGRAGMEKADKADSELGQKSNQMLAQGLQGYQRALQGMPEQTVPNDASGDEMVTMAAKPGDKQAALAQLLQSGHPALEQFGMQQMLKGPGKFSTTPQYDQQGRAFVMSEDGGMKYLDGVMARDKIVNDNGVFRSEYSTTPTGIAPADPNKPFALGPDGNPVANLPYQEYAKSKARAGATNVQVKTDVKTGESLANQVGPMMKDSTTAAEGAVKQVDAAQRVIKAVDSGNLIAGPGASTRLKLAQIGTALGVGGKDEQERIANTRQTIRGLAELTLQGRQQMRGQGAITESEGALATKAMSGDIDDLTPAEVKMLAQASERAARFNYAEHQRKLQVMQQNPSLQGIAPFYQGPEILPEAAAPTQTQAPAGVRRYNPQTGRIE